MSTKIEYLEDRIIAKNGQAEVTYYKDSKVIVGVALNANIHPLDSATYTLARAIREYEDDKKLKDIGPHEFSHIHGNQPCRCIKTCQICGLVAVDCIAKFGAKSE